MASRIGYRQPQTGNQGFARTEKRLGGPIAILTTDEVATNTVALFRVPKGFVASSLFVATDKLDNNGTPTITFSIGDAASSARFFATSTQAQAGGTVGTTNSIATAALFYEFLADTDVIATFVAGAATPLAGNMTVYMGGFMK